jgi:hypothetical protein
MPERGPPVHGGPRRLKALLEFRLQADFGSKTA